MQHISSTMYFDTMLVVFEKEFESVYHTIVIIPTARGIISFDATERIELHGDVNN